MDNDSINRVEELFKHHIGVLPGDFQLKLDLVVEGQQILAEKLELTMTELKDG